MAAKIDKTDDDSKTLYWGRGDSQPEVFTLRDSAGAAINISTNSYVMGVHAEKDPEAAAMFTIVGTLPGGGTDGRVSFAPTSIQTDRPSATYFYDIQQTDGGGFVRTLMKAKLALEQDISK